MARRATYIKGIRQDYETVLVLDAGNTLFGPTSLTLQTEGRVIVEAMNLMGYVAMTIGDDDAFHSGLEALQQRADDAEFPFLSANLVLVDSEELLFEPYTILNVANRSVAILGLTGSDRELPAEAPGGAILDLLDPVAAAARYVPELSERADIIIVLSNLGMELDRQLATAIPEIDLIAGGRSGQVLAEPMVTEPNGTIIVQAGYRGQWIGAIALNVDSQGVVTSHDGRVVLLTGDFADDPDMLALLSRTRDALSSE